MTQCSDFCVAGAVSTSRASDSVNYVYDKAGNPTSRKELGLTTAYTFNNLNQFASGSWTGKLTVIGEVNYAAGTVTVNGVTGKIFPDRVFEATNISVSVGTNVLTAVYHGPAFTNTQMVATNTSSVVMATPAFGYDAKGNLTNDAEFVYQYDIANRLTNVILKASNVSVLAISYDGLGRRIEVTRNGTTVERYVYFPGSFLVLAILDGSNQLKEIYTHGPDLSGTIGGAGGIGGILAVKYPQQTNAPSYFVHADAMGNIILATDLQGKEVGRYRYSPFGRLLNQTGIFTPRLQFSSKEYDPEPGLLNFGYRHLNPRIGRWMERDRIEEEGGINLYSLNKNNPLSHYDSLGLRPINAKPDGKCDRCGPEVADGLIATMNAVKAKFDALSNGTKAQRCSLSHLFNTWDIVFPSPPRGCGEGPCSETVMVRGTCYDQWKVNYILFGRIASLCDFWRLTMEGLIAGQKLIRKPIIDRDWENEYTDDVRGFARIGYNWNGNLPSSLPSSTGGFDACKRCDAPGSTDSKYKTTFFTTWP